MAEMNGSIGIGKCAGDKNVSLAHNSFYYLPVIGEALFLRVLNIPMRGVFFIRFTFNHKIGFNTRPLNSGEESSLLVLKK